MYTSKWLLAVLTGGFLISNSGLGVSSQQAQAAEGRQDSVTGPSANIAAQARGLQFRAIGPAGTVEDASKLGIDNPDRQNFNETINGTTFQEYSASRGATEYLADPPEAVQAFLGKPSRGNPLKLGEVLLGQGNTVQGNNRDQNATQAGPATGAQDNGNPQVTIVNDLEGNNAFHEWDIVALTLDPNTGKVIGAGQSLLGATASLDPSDPNPAVAPNSVNVQVPNVDRVTPVTFCCRIHSNCDGQGTDLEAVATLVPNNANSLQQDGSGNQLGAPNSGHQGGQAMLREIRRNSPVDVLGGWLNNVLRQVKARVTG